MDSDTQADKSNIGKWFAGILAAVITSVLIFWLTEGLRSPTPQPAPQPGRPDDSRPGDTQINGGPIAVRCSANPHVLSPGSQTELVIQAISSRNTPIAEANVRVEAGGGEFPASATTTVVGRTDYSGSFRAIWKSPPNAAPRYVMSVHVSKSGFVDGKGDCLALIQ